MAGCAAVLALPTEPEASPPELGGEAQSQGNREIVIFTHCAYPKQKSHKPSDYGPMCVVKISIINGLRKFDFAPGEIPCVPFGGLGVL